MVPFFLSLMLAQVNNLTPAVFLVLRPAGKILRACIHGMLPAKANFAATRYGKAVKELPKRVLWL